jgi:hypothetical protein
MGVRLSPFWCLGSDDRFIDPDWLVEIEADAVAKLSDGSPREPPEKLSARAKPSTLMLRTCGKLALTVATQSLGPKSPAPAPEASRQYRPRYIRLDFSKFLVSIQIDGDHRSRQSSQA